MDNFVWSNVHDVMLGVRYAPLKWLKFHLEGHAFWLDKRKDAWYFRPNVVLRQDPTGRASSQAASTPAASAWLSQPSTRRGAFALHSKDQ